MAANDKLRPETQISKSYRQTTRRNDALTIKNFIGLPPSSYVSDSVLFNSLPVIRVSPQKPKISAGLTLFTLESAQIEYNNILSHLGFKLEQPNDPLRIVFSADTLPVDTFSNDYTETFLQQMTNAASQGLGQIAQIAGANTATEAIKKLAGEAKKAAEGEGMVKGFIRSGAQTGAKLTTEIEDLVGNLRSQGGVFGGAAAIVNKMWAGHRVDFPKVWGNSSYTTSFSINVKLFNPRPNNNDYARQYLIGPLAALLCLALPRTDDGFTYNWPFFQKVEAPGFINLIPAAITNITVTKGGDAHQMAYTKTLGIIDVNIGFTSLFETMLLEDPDGVIHTQRPTVKNYIENLYKNKDAYQIYNRDEMNKNASNAAGAAEAGGPIIISTTPDPKTAASRLSAESLLAKNFSSTRRVTEAVEAATTGPNRVNNAVSQVSNSLNSINSDFIPKISGV
jgi:hypothetical protein